MDGEGKKLGEVRCEMRGELREDGQRRGRVLSALEDSSQSRLCEVKVEQTVENVYNYFVNRIHTSHAASITYKTRRSQKGKPK